MGCFYTKSFKHYLLLKYHTNFGRANNNTKSGCHAPRTIKPQNHEIALISGIFLGGYENRIWYK